MPARRASALANLDKVRLKQSESGLSPINRVNDLSPNSILKNINLRKSQAGATRPNQLLEGLESIKERQAARATSMSQTQQSYRTDNNDANRVKKENIKARVAYEWKQIYRNLNKFDTDQTGLASKAQF